MKENLSKNLKYLRKKSGKSQTELGSQLGKAHTSIGNWEKGLAEPSLTEIGEIARIFEISPEALLFSDLTVVHPTSNSENQSDVHQNVHPTVHPTGQNGSKGENSLRISTVGLYGAEHGRNTATMPKVVTLDTQGEENAVLVPVRARAGYLLGYGDPVFIGTLPAYSLPAHRNGTFRIFEVEGLSMFNTLQDNDSVVARWIEVSEIRDDRIHVLITKNDGILIKRVLARPADGKLICKSDNNHKGEYPNIVLDYSEVLEAWYVVERWTRMLPSPGELYKRLVDLEGSVALLMQRIGKP